MTSITITKEDFVRVREIINSTFDELDAYRAIGTPEEIRKMAELLKWYADSDMAPNMDRDARALLLCLEAKDGREGE